MVIKAYRALAARVIVVATVNEDVRDWAAYIDAVPGHQHVDEYEEVGNIGEKLPQNVATLLFPTIAAEYRWRD